MTFSGREAAWGYSPLDQINRKNVKELAAVWAFPSGELAPGAGMSTEPLVMDGVMYLLAPYDRLYAIDAVSGKELWRYWYPLAPLEFVPYSPNARGLAIGYGLVYFGTIDNHVVAVDQKTGHEVWDVQVEDVRQCSCNIDSAPILARDKLIVGVTGGESAHRGYINAFDAKTGKHVWRFFVIPGPGDPNFGTWKGDSWKTGGGGPWFTGAYDPDLNLIYWGTGNASSDYYGENRLGSNLYTASLVAIDAGTGELKWYYQETPHDVYDYDSAYEPMLIDLDRNGKREKLIVHPSKNGFVYVLNRETGRFINAWPYVKNVTWTKGFDENGKPIDQVFPALGKSTVLCPSGMTGARKPNHSAYSPRTGWYYNIGWEICAAYTPQKGPVDEGKIWFGTGGTDPANPPDGPIRGHIDAWDPITGRNVWSYAVPFPMPHAALMATAGDLIFTGDPDGNVIALDAKTGEKLWSFNTGAAIHGSPISYAVNGRQYVAVGSGISTIGGQIGANVPILRDPDGPRQASTLFVFALPDSAANSAGAGR